jgi:DNA-3-methyladenine glycosylase II
LKASDRRLSRLIESIDPVDIGGWRRAREFGDAFGTLIYGIIGQQISGYAARAIAGRLREHFGGRMPTPAELAATDGETLRKVGLSRAKVEYVHSLADHVLSGELQIDRLHRLPDEEVRRQLTSIKGIGPWSADMFLLINLQRPDVLPTGDLGIRAAVERLYRIDHLPTPREVEAIGQKWRPNRSLASLYLWASGRPQAPAAADKRGSRNG